MEEVTPLEYNSWMRRLGRKLEEPSRADYYIMLLTMETRRLYKSQIKDASPMKLEDFLLPIKKESPTPQQSSPEEKDNDVAQATAISKHNWLMRINSAKEKK